MNPSLDEVSKCSVFFAGLCIGIRFILIY